MTIEPIRAYDPYQPRIFPKAPPRPLSAKAMELLRQIQSGAKGAERTSPATTLVKYGFAQWDRWLLQITDHGSAYLKSVDAQNGKDSK